MNYAKTYFKIIRTALLRGICSKEYYENHHILPKSIVKNSKTVSLTGREHYICHKLIYKHCRKVYGEKSTRTKKALIAFFFMSNRLGIKRSHEYEELRTKYSLLVKRRRRVEYKFFNINGDEFIGTMTELCHKYKLNHSLIYMVVAGQRRHHKGWSLLKNLPPVKYKSQKMTLVHKDYGTFTGSISDFVENFSNQKLSFSNLRAVKSGNRLSHKGWMLPGKTLKIKRYRWVHNDYGEFQGSITELANLFSDKKLNRGHLSSVVNGKLKQHKGWKIT